MRNYGLCMNLIQSDTTDELYTWYSSLQLSEGENSAHGGLWIEPLNYKSGKVKAVKTPHTQKKWQTAATDML